MKKKTVLKDAGVLLIVVVMVLSTVAATANTTNKRTVMLNTMNDRTVILYEGFEDGVMPPPGWSVYDYGEEGWGITTESFSGENAAYWTGSVASELISPTVDCSAMTEVYLSFWYKQPSLAKGQDTLSVYVSIDGGATWNMVADYTGEITAYTHEMIDLTAYAGEIDVQVKFTATGGGGDGVYLDEIRFCDGYATEFMGIEVAPLGVAELEIIDTNLSVSNCVSGQPETDGVWINLEDTYNQWDCIMENPDVDNSLPIGAIWYTELKGVVDGVPDQFIGAMRLTKVDDYESELAVIGATDYTLQAFIDDELLYIYEFSSEGDDEWVILGNLIYNASREPLHWWDSHFLVPVQHGPHTIGVYACGWTGYGYFEFVSWLPIPPAERCDQIAVICKKGGPIPIESPIDILNTVYDIPEATINEMYQFVNNQPEDLSIDGPTSGSAGTAYDYTVSAVDPDDDQIFYFIDWGDDSDIEYIGPYTSGETVTVSHTWSEQGTYTIRTKARDERRAESGWETLEVEMPVNQQVVVSNQQILKTIFQRFLSFRQNIFGSPLMN